MKKFTFFFRYPLCFILLLPAFLLRSALCFSQPDTNLYPSKTAQKVSAWLQNLTLTPTVSNISGMSNNLGILEIGPNSRDTVKAKGISDYYANASLMNSDFMFAGQNMRDCFRNAKRAGIGLVRCPNMFPLGTIEPKIGTFNYQFSDSTVKIAGDYGVNIVGTILPWADWADSCNTATPSCNLYASGADWFYIDNNRTGPLCPNDTSAFYTFVQNLVKRYGPGGNMPGLTNPVKYWEFCNEPDASSQGTCGSYDSATYLNDLKLTYRALKAACASCELLNGGSVGISNDTSWWYYVLTNGYNYLNIGNFHDNDGRTTYPFDFIHYIANVNNFQHPLNKEGVKYPLWVTEWGLYSGTPSGLGGKLTLRTEDQQSAMYTKVYSWGLANNIGNEMFDVIGDTASIGSAGLINEGGFPTITDSARLFFYTQKLLQYKFRNFDSARVAVFDTSTSLDSGNVKVYVQGNPYYILWGLHSLPVGLSGTKIVTDIYGNADTENVASLSLPLGSDPIIVENATSVAINELKVESEKLKVYPNPNKGIFTIANSYQLMANSFIEIYNVLGEKVYSQFSIFNSPLSINLSSQPSGIYFYRITGGNSQPVEGKFVICK